MIEIDKVHKSFGKLDVLKGVSMTVNKGEVISVIGGSGSGKSTLLMCINGLEAIQGGVIRVDGTDVHAPQTNINQLRQRIGIVFQQWNAFPHLTVLENVMLAPRKVRGMSAAQAEEVAVTQLSHVGLQDKLKVFPGKLSGGQLQRMAIARALARQPRVLLLDEPLAALDRSRKQDILPWLEALRDRLHIPMLYVTHAMDEVARLADTLVLLEAGRVRACGPVAEVMLRHLSVGMDDAGALLDAAVRGRDAVWQLAEVGFDGGSLWLRDSQGLEPGRRVRVRVLARDVSLALTAPAGTSIQNQLACTVESIALDAHPSQVLVRLRCGTATLLARVTARSAAQLELAAGRAVWALVKSVALVE